MSADTVGNVPGPEAMGGPDADSLANPKNLADVLQKHADLKAGAESVAIKRGRGRPPKNPGQPGPAKSPQLPRPGGSDIPADLFTAETVRPFVELPFGLAGVWFKTDQFRLDTRESDALSNQGALVANLFAPGWNPKAVALAAFSLGFAAIATRKLMGYLGERATKSKEGKGAT